MKADQYNRLNTLLSEFSTITALLEAAEAEIKGAQLDAAKDLLPKHAEAKVSLTDLEAELRKMADAHYEELFPSEDKRTHKTPFGTLQYRKSTSLSVEDEEKSILKIKLQADREQQRAERQCEAPRFTLAQLVRQREELNLEALAELDDATLAMFGVTREHKDTFKIVPFEMNADKPAKKERKVAA